MIRLEQPSPEVVVHRLGEARVDLEVDVAIDAADVAVRAVQAVLDLGGRVVALLQVPLRLVPGVVALCIAADQENEQRENGRDRDEHFERPGPSQGIQERAPDGRIAGSFLDGCAEHDVIDDHLDRPREHDQRHGDGEEHQRELEEETAEEVTGKEHPPRRNLQRLAEAQVGVRVDQAGAPVEFGLAFAQRRLGGYDVRHEPASPVARDRFDSASTNAR